MMWLRLTAVAALSLLIQLSVQARNNPAAAEIPSAQIDKLFEKMDKTVSPGCALAVMKDGRIIYERGYGMADLDHNVPITLGTIFHVALNSEGDGIRRITLKGDRLQISPGAGDESYELKALNENRFRLVIAPVHSTFESSNPRGSLRLIREAG
jgi:hypothetical protein